VNDILVERRWPHPLSESEMHSMMSMGEGCLRIHRVTFCGSLLSTDGMDLLCHFRSPDTESVRIAMRQLGSPPARIWACQTQDAPGIEPADLTHVNVAVSHEFDAPAEFGERQMLEDVDVGCFRLHRVRLVRSQLSMDRLRMVCLYQAPDAESVRLVQRAAGLPPDRVWAVRRYAP
jgi:Protein of unknown function (DUF4242)